MKKTLFAGVTILEPGEPLSTDNGAYTGRDRQAIDHFLELGAKTHRHNGLAGLSNPTTPVTAEVIASGGALGGGLGISLGWTQEDAQGGETMLSPLTVLSTPPPLSGPIAMPSAVADYTGGELLVNTYFYALTWTDGEGGETPLGPAVTVERRPGDEHGQVQLSALAFGMGGASASGWRLFRAVGGGSYSLLATGGASEDTFTDDGTHSLQCDIHPPAGETNTTRGVSTLVVTVPDPAGPFVNLYASVTGDFSGSSLIGRYPQASAGATVIFPSLELLPISPPPINRSVGGANKIDPDTELIEWHWKRPVKAFVNLPAGETGDVRLVEEEATIYAFLEGEWESIGGGGGGGTQHGMLSAFGQNDSPGLASGVTDSFASGSIDTHWHDAEGASAIAFTQSGGHLRGTPGGMIFRSDTEAGDQRIVAKFHTQEDLFEGIGTALFGEVGEELTPLWFDLENGDEVTLWCGTHFVESRAVTTLKKNHDYWFRMTKRGPELIYEIWETDPALGGTAVFTWLHTLDKDNPDESIFIEREYFGGLSYSGPESEGGFFDEWRSDKITAGYVEDVRLLELRGLTVASAGPGHVVVTASGGGGGGGGSSPDVTDGVTTVSAPATIAVEGAEEATTVVDEPSPGIARITVAATASGGGGGGGIEVTDGSAVVGTAEAIEIVGEGEVEVAVTEPEGGLAKVTVAVDGGVDVFASGASGGREVEKLHVVDTFAGEAFESQWEVVEGGGAPGSFWTIGGGHISNSSGAPIVRTDAEAQDAEIVVHYNAKESSFFEMFAILALPAGRLQLGFQPGENLLKIGSDVETYVSTAFTQVANTDYWIKATKTGNLLKVEMWLTDPSLGGASLAHVEHTLNHEVSDENRFIGKELLGGLFGAGSPGGQVFDFLYEATRTEIPPDAGYVRDATKVEFDGFADVASGGAFLAEVTVGPSRGWASAGPTAGLAASASQNLIFPIQGHTASLLKISTDHKARVRVYGDASARSADTGRAIGTDPSGDHGVLLDYANTLTPSAGEHRLTPVITAANLDTQPAKKLYLRVTNLEATEKTITVAFLSLPLEV